MSVFADQAPSGSVPWGHSAFAYVAQPRIPPPPPPTNATSNSVQSQYSANATGNVPSFVNASVHVSIPQNAGGLQYAPSTQPSSAAMPNPVNGLPPAASTRTVVEMTEDDIEDFYKTAFNRGVDFGFELGHKMCFEKYYSNNDGAGAPMQPRAFTPPSTSGTTTEYVVNEQTE